MLGTLRGRIIVILAVLAVSGWALYDNYNSCVREREASGSETTCSVIKLGLDLQGGMHLVLEVDDPEGTMPADQRADATDRALKIIRTRIDQFGVEEPLIQKVGDERIIVELAGISDEERAKDILQQTAFLEFYLVQGGQEFRNALSRIDRAIVDAGIAAGPGEVEGGERQAFEALIFGDTAPADTAAAAEEAAPRNRRPLTSLLMEAGQNAGIFLVEEANVELVDRYLSHEAVQRVLPRRTTLRWGSDTQGRGAQLYRELFVLEAQPFMTGEVLENAVAGRDQQFNETIVSFELNRRGGRIFDRVTSQNIGELIAIVLDDEVYSAPQVQSRIGARGQIELGQAPMEEARDLALVLRAGALPAPLRIIEERTIGPSLGHDSVNKGEIAGIVGIVLVIGVMLTYYRLAGMLAVFALGVYVMIVMGGLAAFNATLTLPGIAGLVLSIGMAVDANVLIFERTREELAAGRIPRTAVDEGFKNAMSAIVDSNLTTLLTALILFNFGTGPVRGFAVTLSIGIVASFFSAVYVTRTFFLLYLTRKGATEAISI